ncbi:hypothetical protein [Rhizobium sp. 18065]|uniref:COG3904 family protein n=1 Tax=Rhizobium sp. 18065 TaxID=2681411 RepID=UPI00135C3617|nr:hypothetical protein [Rhizobium sp. 18065]
MKRLGWYSFLCGASVAISPAAAIEFDHGTTKAGHGYVVVSGEISEDSPAAFEAYISSLSSKAQFVMLDSPGGSVIGGVGLGEAIRAADMSTVVPGDSECASSCAFAFIGGSSRMVFDGGKLGVHQFRWEGDIESAEAVESSQSFAGVLMAYFRSMGVSSEVLTVAMMTPPSSMYYFSPGELKAFGLVTPPPVAAGEEPCPFPPGHKVSDPLGLFPQCK